MIRQASSRYPLLFSPVKIGALEQPNRLVMAPMATSFAGAGGEVTGHQIAYYRERARGGVGLIVVENANVDFPAGVSAGTQLRIDQDRFIPGLARLSSAIHQQGALCALQINHGGALAKKAADYGATPLAPSPAPDGLYPTSPRALSAEEIAGLVERFARAAERAGQAGFDAVEIHGAHAYLIAQFISPLSNHRTDDFGGDIAGRARFACQVAARSRQLLGPDFPILFRLNVSDLLPGGLEPDQAAAAARMLIAQGVDALDLSLGSHYQINRSFCSLLEPMSYAQGWRLDLVSKVKDALDKPVIAVGPFREPAKAEEALAAGKLDLVSLGRPLIADPAWPRKARQGREADIRRCISCNQGCVDNRLFKGRPISCAVNPLVGWEGSARPLVRGQGRRVLVVGGGPAGCAAATKAAQGGHQVVLLERDAELGGNCLLASRLAHKERLAWVVQDQKTTLARCGVDIRLQTAFSTDLLAETDPEVLVWAAGAEPALPPGVELAGQRPLHAEEVLRRRPGWQSLSIVVIGGGATGCQLALTLAEQGNRVTVLEALAEAAPDLEPLSRFDLLDRLARHDRIELISQALVQRAEEQRVEYQAAGTGAQTLAADRIVWATGYQSRLLSSDLRARFPGLKMVRIGDALRPRNVLCAVSEGFWLGRNL